MTMNPNAIAGPSKRLETPPKIEPPSPSSSLDSDLKEMTPNRGDHPGGVSKPGLSVDENGEVVKVPAFLQKLYSMVSDPGTDELIFWANSGDSFFVPDHQRFGKEILPRFFKHNNFSSFVRQLNMYGFHKVPQPQTGVLRQDNPNDSELWEFVSPFFRRGQPALLAKVTRKNNRPGVPPPTTGSTGTRSSARQAGQGVSGQYLITDGTTEGEEGAVVGPTGQQMVDLAAITSGIQAIRQTQAAIGADLKALQSSNEHLWREAMEQRERHRTHQETIDLIVTFLERLFGTEGEGLKGLKEAMRRGGLGGLSGLSRQREDSAGEAETVGKKRKRLGMDRMIGDGRGQDGEKDDGQIVEIQSGSNEHSIEDPFSYSIPRLNRNRPSNPSSATTDPWSSTSDRFQALPTDDENRFQPIPSSAGSTRIPTPADPFMGTGMSPDSTTAIDPNALVRYYNNTNNANAGNVPNPMPNNTGAGGGNPPMSPTTTAAAASAFNLDPSILQTTIGSLLQSPAAAQMFLNSLNNSIQGQALQTPTKNPSPVIPNASQQQPLTQLQFNQPYGQQPNVNVNKGDVDPTLALFSPLPHHTSLVQNNDALMKSYQDAIGVGGDVEKLQGEIDDLVRSMGLDIRAGDAQGQGGLMGMENGLAAGEDLGGLDPDFNVDEFLEHLAKENEAAKGESGQ